MQQLLPPFTIKSQKNSSTNRVQQQKYCGASLIHCSQKPQNTVRDTQSTIYVSRYALYEIEGNGYLQKPIVMILRWKLSQKKMENLKIFFRWVENTPYPLIVPTPPTFYYLISATQIFIGVNGGRYIEINIRENDR